MAALFPAEQRSFVHAVANLGYSNPFLPERIAWEREALGSDFNSEAADWNVHVGAEGDHPNLTRLNARAKQVLEAACARLAEPLRKQRVSVDPIEAQLLEDLVLFVLYHDYRAGLDRIIAEASSTDSVKPGSVYRKLCADAARYARGAECLAPLVEQLPHIFAGFFQIRRAFSNIFLFIVGRSQ